METIFEDLDGGAEFLYSCNVVALGIMRLESHFYDGQIQN